MTKYTRKMLLADAERAELRIAQVSKNYMFPLIITATGRAKASVVIWENGAITRSDVRADVAKGMTPKQAAKALHLAT